MEGAPRTTAYVIRAREQAAKALELRKRGLTFLDIAEELGYKSPQAAHDAVKRALDRLTSEPAEQVRALEAARLDDMFRIQYAKILEGDTTAIPPALKIMERRAKMMGIDIEQMNEKTITVIGAQPEPKWELPDPASGANAPQGADSSESEED